jgi:coenzyme Q-binding protein COQ10
MPRHAEQRFLPYSPAQMFELVAAVERYPEFLPWCLGCRIVKREPTLLEADLLIGFKLFRERWGSRVTLKPPDTIEVEYTHGPFRHLENRWRFLDHPDGCQVDFFVEFEFSSRLLGKVASGLFGDAVQRMVRAFETRARQVYGTPNDARALSG